MGSRRARLMLPEELRQWQSAGVRYVLADRPVRDLRPGASAQPAAKPAPQSTTKPAAAPQTKRAPGALQQSRATRPPRRSPQASAPSAGLPDLPELPDLCAPAAELPAAWQVYASRAPSRSYSVWTYWEYAQDVSSSPSPQRRELWGRMIGNLGWPKGCVAFWPVSEPAEPTPGAAGQPRLLARADLFWRGFLDLGAEVLVCFGRPAFLTLFPERRFALTRFVWRGRQVLCLPDPLELASAPAEVKKRVWELLQSLTPS